MDRLSRLLHDNAKNDAYCAALGVKLIFRNAVRIGDYGSNL